MNNKNALGQRMKENYEAVTAHKLPRRTYTIIRLDGQAFHTYAKYCNRPYDAQLHEAMSKAARKSILEMQGAVCAYVQSDEVSILLTDFENPQTDAWFGGKIQKIVSISASMMTAHFNQLRYVQCKLHEDIAKNYLGVLAHFDARVFTIPDVTEVFNYFVWRQKDAVNNSIQMLGQSKFSARELHGKSTDQIQEMLWDQHKMNWNDVADNFKRGSMVRIDHTRYAPFDGAIYRSPDSKWVIEAPPIFTQNHDYLEGIVPRYT